MPSAGDEGRLENVPTPTLMTFAKFVPHEFAALHFRGDGRAHLTRRPCCVAKLPTTHSRTVDVPMRGSDPI